MSLDLDNHLDSSVLENPQIARKCSMLRNVLKEGNAEWKRRVLVALTMGIFAWFRLWQATASPALTWQDSRNYEAIGSLPLWSGGFWFGGRPPLTPLLWEVTGSARAFLIGQTLISIASWGFLAWSVGSLFSRDWRGLVGTVTVFAFATTTPIMLWDRSVLSESLALSGVALLFATGIRLAQKPTKFKATVFVFAAFWCALARDTEIIVPVTLGLLLFVFAVVNRRIRQRKTLIVTASALVLAAGFCVANLLESGRDALNTTDNMNVRVFPYPAAVAWFASHGMPQSEAIDKLAKTELPPPSGTAKTVVPDLKSPAFARLRVWINKEGASTYAFWLITHPWDVVAAPLRRPERTYNNAHGSVYSYAAQNRVTSGLTPVLWPPWIWMVAMVAVAFAIALEVNLHMTRVAQMIIILGALGVPAILVAWNGDGQEVTRHTIEGLAQVRIGVLILLLWSVLSRAPLRLNSSREATWTRDLALTDSKPAPVNQLVEESRVSRLESRRQELRP
jgi:hypothetical protein